MIPCKHYLTAFFLLAMAVWPFQLFAHAPQKVSYQMVVRDASGELVKESTVGVQVSILQGTAEGSAVYIETHAPTTNVNGLVSIEVGNGTPTGSTFADIDWSNSPYFLKVETDPAGGNAYTISGISEILSVPYALHAKTAENFTGTLNETDPSVPVGTTPGEMQYWNGSAWVTIEAGRAGQSLTFINGMPVWIDEEIDEFFWPRDTQTAVVDVTNPATGKTWMDRNLGATRAATSSTDSEAYGDLYQWGRAADGHEKRNSPTTTTLSNNDTPGHGSFIVPSDNTSDWRSIQNNMLWQGHIGINNPCPSGYRLPTESEWNAEIQSWGNNNAINSMLKLPMPGSRYEGGELFNVGSAGTYWTSTIDGNDSYKSRQLGLIINNASMNSSSRCLGLSVRCIKVEVLEESWIRDTVTKVINVSNPTTGKIWMDRNLGATRVANSTTDTNAYGDLYQWGREKDGHEKRNSIVTYDVSASNNPAHGKFILQFNYPNDWRSPQNNFLWIGSNGINNPCPIGYRLPTMAEWEAERQSWLSNNAAGGFTSPLKLTMSGFRNDYTGTLTQAGTNGQYWSSSTISVFSYFLYFTTEDAYISFLNRATGRSVRCIMDY